MPSSWYDPESIPQGFSTSEVTSQTLRHGESLKELPGPSGLEVLNPDAVHLPTDARHSYSDAPEVAYLTPIPTSLSSPLPASSFDGNSGRLLNEKERNENHRPPRKICGWASKPFWFSLALAALTIAVVVGLAVGIPLGLQNAHRRHESASDASSSQASNPATGVNNGSSLAAIAFNDTLGILHHRVYYQDDAGEIKESSWNSSSKLWQVSNSAIGQAKMNTPLAAIVTGPPQYTFVSNNFW